MARKPKTSQLFEVRNLKGQYLATYRALTAQAAIDRFLSDQQVYNSQFRGGYRIQASDLTAEAK